MSPFLAQVQVINVAGKTHHSAADIIEAARVIANQALDAARAAADATTDAAATNVQVRSKDAEPEAAVKEDSPDKDNDDADEKTVQISPGGKVVVKHKKSSGETIPSAVIPIVAIFFVFTYLIIKALMAPFTGRNKRRQQVSVAAGLSEEEMVILEKLQRTLAQMEGRVESLETILIDQSRTKEKYGTKL